MAHLGSRTVVRRTGRGGYMRTLEGPGRFPVRFTGDVPSFDSGARLAGGAPGGDDAGVQAAAADPHLRARGLDDGRHRVRQQLADLANLDILVERTGMVDVEDSEFRASARQESDGGDRARVDRPGRCRGVGESVVAAIVAIPAVTDVDGSAVVEGECALEPREPGGHDSVAFVRGHLFPVTEPPCDDGTGAGDGTAGDQRLAVLGR
jgi:hypothetical protein